MLKKRIIFVLFYKDGAFHLSRNFRLQRVGNVDWLLDKFNFFSIGSYVDELIVLDVSNSLGKQNNSNEMLADVQRLMSGIFVPLTIGGGIRSQEQAEGFFQAGADKISLNWALVNDQALVKKLVKRYGTQAIVASVDVKKSSDSWDVYTGGASLRCGSLLHVLSCIDELNVGEVLLTSIDRDGTAEGLDVALYENERLYTLNIPIIACGGVGRPDHVSKVFASTRISAVATGNLFNFIGTGFVELRQKVADCHHDVRKI